MRTNRRQSSGGNSWKFLNPGVKRAAYASIACLYCHTPHFENDFNQSGQAGSQEFERSNLEATWCGLFEALSIQPTPVRIQFRVRDPRTLAIVRITMPPMTAPMKPAGSIRERSR
jgi:hypothetical protein